MNYLETAGAVENETAVAADLAMAAAKPTPISPNDGDGLLSIVVPQGAKHELIDLESHLLTPKRVKGTVTAHTVDDLVRYVKRHDDAAATTLWLNTKSHKVVAVLDDHGADGAAWGQHRAELQLEKTPEWLHWESLDNRLVGQDQFSEHIEQGLNEIETPDAATMLELSQSIQGSVGSTFKSTRRLQDGSVELQYVEDPDVSAGASGEIPIPKTLTLYIAPFVGEDPVRIDARFRYRVRGGTVALGYSLERPWQVIREAVERVGANLVATFEPEEGPSRVFLGSPRA